MIYAHDISKFLIDRNYTPTSAMVDLMYKRIDKHGVKEPKIDDFKREMLPRTSIAV